MSFLNFLKATPVKLTLGTAGVAGASVFAVKASVKSKKERDAEELKELLKTKYAPSDKKMKFILKEDMDKWDDWFKNASNKDLGLKTFNCSLGFFPGAKWPEKFNIPNISINPPPIQDADLKLAPSKTSGSRPQACLTMHLKRKPKNKMLLRSELTIKNENVGIAFWTVLKNFEETRVLDRSPYYFLFFLEKGNTDGKETWSIKMGYSWGGESSKQSSKPLIVKSPDAANSLNKRSELDDAQEVDESFFGIWSEAAGGTDRMLVIKDQELSTSQEDTFSPLDVQKNVSSLIFGFCKDGCLETNNSFKWSVPSTLSSKNKTSISKTIEDWYGVFKDKTGTWKKLTDHCQSKSQTNLDESHDNDPCFMKNPERQATQISPPVGK